MSDLNHQIQFYDQYWSALEFFGSYKIQRVICILKYLLPLRKRAPLQKILDLGCGDGRSVGIWSVVMDCEGLDLSTKAMEEASKRFPAFTFKSGDATKTDYPDRSFGVIISQEVIEHIEIQRDYLGECHRLLATDGFLILTTPNKFYFDRLKGGNYSHQPIENLIDRDALHELMGKYFIIEKSESVIVAKGDFGIYRLLSNRWVVAVLGRLRLGTWYQRQMERWWLGVHLIVVARKR